MTITTPAELDTLPLQTVVACVSTVANVPVVIVFQRGSHNEPGDGWCTPDTPGQIPAEGVFEFIGLNGFPPELTVLHNPWEGAK